MVIKRAKLLVVFSLCALLFSLPITLAFELQNNLTYDGNGNLITGDDKYRVYNEFNQLIGIYEGDNDNGDNNYDPSCSSNPKMGETAEYVGLKSSSSETYADLKNKINGFPESKEFRIRVIKTDGTELPAYAPSGSPTPPEDVTVYVYEFVYPLLEWENNQPTKVNYIVSIQIW